MAEPLRGNKLLVDVSLLESKSTLKEYLGRRCRLTYNPRKIRNRGAILVLVWSYLITSVFHLLMKYDDSAYERMWQVFAGLTLSLAGWIADTYTGRYKFIRCSLWLTWFAMLLAMASSVADQLSDIYDVVHTKIWTFLLDTMAVGLGGFQANVIQFGIDQLQDASTAEIKSFIIWYIWTVFGSGIIIDFAFSCVSKQYVIFRLLYVCVHISLALVLMFWYGNAIWLVKEPAIKSPFKLVYRVIRYAIKNKHPRQRSAFTFCEDYIPSRIDFGKIKYGGPFTTEQVEDVKTFLRLLPIIIVGSVIAGAFFAMKQIRHYFTRQLAHSADSDGDPMAYSLSQCYIEASFHIFSYTAIFLIILHEFIIYPVFQRLYPQIKSSHKIVIGIILQIATIVLLATYEAYSRYKLLSNNSTNATIQCMFYEHQGALSRSFDYRFMVIPDTLSSSSILLVALGSLEFLTSQIPFQMKGIILGVSYGSTFIFGVIGAFVMWPFMSRLSVWGSGVFSCGFWFTMLLLLVEVLVCFVLIPLSRKYKRRKREDVLPNEHYYAERYYSQDPVTGVVN